MPVDTWRQENRERKIDERADDIDSTAMMPDNSPAMSAALSGGCHPARDLARCADVSTIFLQKFLTRSPQQDAWSASDADVDDRCRRHGRPSVSMSEEHVWVRAGTVR